MASYEGIEKIKNQTGVAALDVIQTIHRTSDMPIDSTEVFESLEQAQKYARGEDTGNVYQSSACSYVGQKITVVDKDLSTADTYTITDGNGTLKKVADQNDVDDIMEEVSKLSSDTDFNIESTNPVQNKTVTTYKNLVDDNLLVLNEIKNDVAFLSVNENDDFEKVKNNVSAIIQIFRGMYSYIIYTPSDLVALAKQVRYGNSFVGQTFTLANDIDMTGVEMSSIGYAGKTFRGIFEGNGHTISNIKISNWTSGSKGCGLFGAVEKIKDGVYCEIRNLNIDNISVDTNYSWSGTLIGHGNGYSINNCKVTNAHVKCRVQTGGLVGAGEGNIVDSSFDGDLSIINTGDNTWDAWNGGLIGSLQGGYIYNSTANGNVYLLESSTQELIPESRLSVTSIGGIAGRSCFMLASQNGIYGHIVNCSANMPIRYVNGKIGEYPIIGVYAVHDNDYKNQLNDLTYAMIKNTTCKNTWDKSSHNVESNSLIDVLFNDTLSTLGYNDLPCYPCDGYPQFGRDGLVSVIMPLSSNLTQLTNNQIINDNVVCFEGENLDKLYLSCSVGFDTTQTYAYTPLVQLDGKGLVEQLGNNKIKVTIPKYYFDQQKINRFSMLYTKTLNSAIVLAYDGKMIQVPINFVFTPAVSIDPTEFTFTGSGKEYEAIVSVKYDDQVLLSGTDYLASYTNNQGTVTALSTINATVSLSGIGNYSGQITKKFKIYTKI